MKKGPSEKGKKETLEKVHVSGEGFSNNHDVHEKELGN